jgi:hypothetical protein
MIIEVKKLGARKPVVSDGTVTLPVKEYNAMIKKLIAYESALVVRYDSNTWRGNREHEVRVEFKVEPFKDLILDKMTEFSVDKLSIFEGQEIDFDRTVGYTSICSYSEIVEEEEKTE